MGLTVKTEQVRVTLKTKQYLKLFRERGQKAFFAASAEMARAAERNAKNQGIYDPQSKHAAGLTTFPAIHHAESFRPFAKVKDDGIRAGFASTSGRAWWNETGTIKMAARPHIKPAFDQNRGLVLDLLEGMMDQGEI